MKVKSLPDAKPAPGSRRLATNLQHAMLRPSDATLQGMKQTAV